MAKKQKKEIKETKDGEPKKANGVSDVLDSRVRKNIIAVLLIMLALIMLLSLVDLAGVAGQYIDNGLSFLFGWGRFLLPVVMIVLGALYFRKMEPIRYTLAAIGAVLFYVMFLGLSHIFIDMDMMISVAKDGGGGGYAGLATAYPLAMYLGKIAGVVILFGFSLIGIMLIFNAPLLHLLNVLKARFFLPRKQDKEETETAEEQQQSPKELESEEFGDNIKSIEFVQGPEDDELKSVEPSQTGISGSSQMRTKKNIYSGLNWKLPPLDLLQKNKERPHQANLDQNVEIITKTFENFGIDVEPSEYHVGPTVTQYTFKPAVGVRLSKILALQDNLSLALAAHPIRIEAPIPGKSLIGVEVPNKEKSTVHAQTMLESDVFSNRPSDLSIILGEDVNGHPILANIEKMPHMLIAGSTGTGKSVCINVVLTTLLYENSPEDLRLILVDPKRVELSTYANVPHLLTPVIVESPKVVSALKWAVEEMEKRYRLLQEVGSRDIHSYNEKVANGKKRKVTDKETGEERQEDLEKMPFIVIVIDELADLMASHGRDVEGLIVRLAQMARAVGIHLIVSTQRPSVEVLTGLIKANITTRIAFQVATQIDSRTILGMAGAEKLLGNGDMLFQNSDSSKPRRIQGIFISEKEVKRVVRFINHQAKEVEFEDNEDLSESLDEQLNSSMGSLTGPDTEGGSDDELYEQAKQVVIEAKKHQRQCCSAD